MEHILNLEDACIKIANQLEETFHYKFQRIGVQISVECLRTVKGRDVEKGQVFHDYYESFIEIGVEEDHEYFPNAYIPIWKFKKDMFQEIGYLTRYDSKGIEKKVTCILQEMLQDRETENELKDECD